MDNYNFEIENKNGIKLCEFANYILNTLNLKLINDNTPITVNKDDQLNVVKITIDKTGIHFITE